jgi:hypothetical protein
LRGRRHRLQTHCPLPPDPYPFLRDRLPAMASPIRLLTVSRYHREGHGSEADHVASPTWADVEAAVRRMDNYYFPFVSLSVHDDPEDDRLEAFWVVGGGGRWAMLRASGDWQYERPGGGEQDVRLWDSDQGYFCKAKNVVTDIDEVLRVTKAFYDSGSCESLGTAEHP